MVSTGTQSPAGVNPKVYDANGRFLGFLVDVGIGTITTFLPRAEVVVAISEWDGYTVDALHSIFFDDYNCSGQGYADSNPHYLTPVGTPEDPRYFVTSLPPLYDPEVLLKSILNPDDGSCANLAEPHPLDGWMKAREIPKRKVPFTLPVVPPFTFK